MNTLIPGVLRINKNARKATRVMYPLFEDKSNAAMTIGTNRITLELKSNRDLNEYPTRSKIPEVKKVS
jgi:hypothetical protein